MALWRGMRYPRSPSVAAAEYDIAESVRQIGLDLTETENKHRYDSQMSAAKAEQIRRENQLWLRLDAAAPEERKPIFDEEITSGTYTKAVTAGMSGPALRDMQNKLTEDIATLEGGFKRWLLAKSREDSVINYQAYIDESLNRDFRDVEDIAKWSNDFFELTDKIRESGADKRLQQEEQAAVFYDEIVSKAYERFLLTGNHADLIDENGNVIEEGYWIKHANELAEGQGVGLSIGKPVFSDSELADLKRQYKSLNSDRKAQALAERKASSDALENKINNDILNLNNPNAEQKLTREQIRQEIVEGDFYEPATKRTLSNYLDSKTGTTVKENDFDALAEAYKIMATDMTQQQKYAKLMTLAPKLESNTVDGFIKDIYEPETTSNDIYKQYSSAITNLKTGRMFSGDIAENVRLSVKAQNLLKQFAKENPEATEKDYDKFFNRLVENQVSWSGLYSNKAFWIGFVKGKVGEQRYSIQRNIEAMQKEYKTTETNDLSSMTDEELLKRIMGK